MITPRLIPALLLSDSALVKTVQFKKRTYLGDPLNVVGIYNDLEADELMFLDIDASRNGRDPDFDLIQNLASQCFMPFSYGGGIRDINSVRRILSFGVEKVVLNSVVSEKPYLIREIADIYGSQSVVVSIDVRKTWMGKYEVILPNQSKPAESDPLKYAQYVEKLGAGEVCLNAVDRDGQMDGYDLALIGMVSKGIGIPLIALGGAGSLQDMVRSIDEGGASAAAAGSIFVYQNKNRNVLVNYPTRAEIIEAFRK